MVNVELGHVVDIQHVRVRDYKETSYVPDRNGTHGLPYLYQPNAHH